MAARIARSLHQRRELYLDRAQRHRFIEKAPSDLADFLRGLCQLPLRPGALAKLQAGDLDRRLKVLKIGQDKNGRRLKLPDVTAKFFEAAIKDKLPTAPLLSRADGKAWNKDHPHAGARNLRHREQIEPVVRGEIAASALARLAI